MVLGHYGAAFALKGFTKTKWRISTLLVAAWFADILCDFLVIIGVEEFRLNPTFVRAFPFQLTHAPYSHGLLGAFILGTGVMAIATIGAKRSIKESSILGFAVFSHFLCDALVHGPDLTLLGAESARVGLGLWNYPIVSHGLEISLFWAGLWAYLHSTAKPNLFAKKAFLALGILFTALALVLPYLPIPSDTFAAAALSLILILSTILLMDRLDRKRVRSN